MVRLRRWILLSLNDFSMVWAFEAQLLNKTQGFGVYWISFNWILSYLHIRIIGNVLNLRFLLSWYHPSYLLRVYIECSWMLWCHPQTQPRHFYLNKNYEERLILVCDNLVWKLGLSIPDSHYSPTYSLVKMIIGQCFNLPFLLSLYHPSYLHREYIEYSWMLWCHPQTQLRQY